MKTKLAIIIGCIFLSSCYSKFSDCGGSSCGYKDSSYSQYCNECQCTDLGYGRNNCISNGKYCEAFGNIGAR